MSGIVEYYNDLVYNRNDKRTENWFLISGPVPLLTIIFSYLYCCTSLGPMIMRNRKPFTLRKTLIVYNFIQVLLSIYLFYEGLMAGWLYDYSFTCQPVDYSTSPKAMRMARGVYMYFICKLIELLDTVFFVLRKKDRQISFLHLYHHAMMPICAWIGVHFVAGGNGTLLGVINAFIHILMYTYYMLAAIGPQMQKYLWWKKHLTSLQLVQFTIILIHNAQVLMRDCDYPRTLSGLLLVNAALFIYLFGSFYIANYNKKPSVKSDKTVQEKLKANGGFSNGNACTNGHSNGYKNGHSNGHTNGYTNGHTNGHANGHSNGHANGYTKVDKKME